MNPKAEKFFDAITLLREDIVEEAQDYRFRKRQSSWMKVGTLAACLVLLASISLLVLPMRGCGGSGGNANMNSSGAPQSADSCAPADEPASGDPRPEPEEAPESAAGGSYGYGEAAQTSFTATVIEIYDDSILVEPAEGEDERNSSDQIVVATRDLELPELAVGDSVQITYDGWIQESYPAGITGVTAIERIEED